MKIQWMAAALLSSALVVGCGGRGGEKTENAPETDGTTVALSPDTGADADQPAPPPPAAQPAQSSPNRDGSAGRAPTSGTGTTSTASRTPAGSAPVARDSAPVRDDDDPPRATAPIVREVTIPAGTSLALELTSSVSTETARVETPVSARVRRPVVINGVTAIPAGAVVNGEVIDVDRPGRVQGRARLGLRFTSVTVAGERQSIRTNPVMFEGEATRGEDATKIGAGAGIGAVVGGILGGGDGAAKGAAIGGAAGTGAVLATRGRDVELGPGADIDATFASATTIDVR